jgi:hypothetical protein
MTEKQLLAVVQEAERQWSILDVLVIHRVGDVFLDDVLVLVVVWSGHRGGAFDASRATSSPSATIQAKSTYSMLSAAKVLSGITCASVACSQTSATLSACSNTSISSDRPNNSFRLRHG